MTDFDKIRREVDFSGSATLYIAKDMSLNMNGEEVPFEIEEVMRQYVKAYDAKVYDDLNKRYPLEEPEYSGTVHIG